MSVALSIISGSLLNSLSPVKCPAAGPLMYQWHRFLFYNVPHRYMRDGIETMAENRLVYLMGSRGH